MIYFIIWATVLLLCRLPALAEATYRDHFCRLASSLLASQKISVTFFSWTTQASFLIFGTEHQYGELYRVTQFPICHMSTSCYMQLRIFLTWTNCHIFLRNHTGQLPDIWHIASVWTSVSCNTVSNLPHVHFLFDATLIFLTWTNLSQSNDWGPENLEIKYVLISYRISQMASHNNISSFI